MLLYRTMKTITIQFPKTMEPAEPLKGMTLVLGASKLRQKTDPFAWAMAIDAANLPIELCNAGMYDRDPDGDGDSVPSVIAAALENVLEAQKDFVYDSKLEAAKVYVDNAESTWGHGFNSESGGEIEVARKQIGWGLPTREFLDLMVAFVESADDAGGGGVGAGNGAGGEADVDAPPAPPLILGIGSGHGYLEWCVHLALASAGRRARVIATDGVRHSALKHVATAHLARPLFSYEDFQPFRATEALSLYGSSASVMLMSFPECGDHDSPPITWPQDAVKDFRHSYGGKKLVVVLQYLLPIRLQHVINDGLEASAKESEKVGEITHPSRFLTAEEEDVIQPVNSREVEWTTGTLELRMELANNWIQDHAVFVEHAGGFRERSVAYFFTARKSVWWQ